TSTPGATYSAAQLIFASAACLILYGALVVSQTMTHKDYFDPQSASGNMMTTHATTPSHPVTALSGIGLIMTPCAVVGLAKVLSPSIEAGIVAIGAPGTVVGVVIALLVLLPETGAAIAAARSNQLQTSLNLALGSGAASVALTIPVVSIFSIITGRQLT